MNKQSSNTTVETQLEKLSSIRKVAPPDSLFDDTLAKIAAVKKSYISMAWVRVAAAVFVILLCAEIMILSADTEVTKTKFNQQEELQSILLPSNNILYND